MVIFIGRFRLLIELLLSLELFFKLAVFTHLSQIVLDREAGLRELDGVSFALGPCE